MLLGVLEVPHLLSPTHASVFKLRAILNPLNAGLNPICHLLTLLQAHHILHVSRIRVKPCLSTTVFMAKHYCIQRLW